MTQDVPTPINPFSPSLDDVMCPGPPPTAPDAECHDHWKGIYQAALDSAWGSYMDQLQVNAQANRVALIGVTAPAEIHRINSLFEGMEERIEAAWAATIVETQAGFAAAVAENCCGA